MLKPAGCQGHCLRVPRSSEPPPVAVRGITTPGSDVPGEDLLRRDRDRDRDRVGRPLRALHHHGDELLPPGPAALLRRSARDARLAGLEPCDRDDANRDTEERTASTSI
ncbi:hypothetical protein GN956_G5087 [Arapaima gigas]